MSNWRAAAQMVLSGGGGFPEVSKTITSRNPPAEIRMNAGAGSASGVSEVYAVYNTPLRIKTFSEKILPIVENYLEIGNYRMVDSGDHIRVTAKTLHKPQKPPKPVNSVSEVYAVPGTVSIPRSIVAAVRTGDPAKIASAAAADPDLAERAAIREYDGKMPRLDAELATLLDAIDEAGYVL
jgi:hypothetical protein